MQTINVKTSAHSYDIHIAENICFSNLSEYDKDQNQFILITDKSIFNLYEKEIKALKSIELYVLPIGESAKSFTELEKLLNYILSLGITRKTKLIALGGGVVGDMVGFAASILLRGIPYIQIPTTLLAQVDSSVGGKTAINTSQGKNLIGSFYQPERVIIDLNFLRTLPKRHLLAGYAEVLKYALIQDSDFFNYLKQHARNFMKLDPDICTHIIKTCCLKKAKIVEEDEKETSGVRALLNFGHTFAHALETLSGYKGDIYHGEAVAIGMVMAINYSVRLGFLHPNEAKDMVSHIKIMGFSLSVSDFFNELTESQYEEFIDDCLAVMQKDKKADKNYLTFIVLNNIGDATLYKTLEFGLIRDILVSYLREN